MIYFSFIKSKGWIFLTYFEFEGRLPGTSLEILAKEMATAALPL